MGLNVWANPEQPDLIYVEQDGSYIRFYTQIYFCKWIRCNGALYLSETDYRRTIGEPGTVQKDASRLPKDAKLLGTCTANTLEIPQEHLQSSWADVTGCRAYLCEDGAALYLESIDSHDDTTYARFLKVELEDLVNSPYFSVSVHSAV